MQKTLFEQRTLHLRPVGMAANLVDSFTLSALDYRRSHTIKTIHYSRPY
ncbi:MAG: hypothetical protein MIO93_08320 [ANME-2 cluster archaeon]|nr:hypothetical protein [ANME-2 cluster archaeon]